MQKDAVLDSRHFAVEPLAGGVYACIHKPGGGAYSNAGIVDLGGRTLVVDAFQTLAAGRALRSTAEALSGRPAEAILLTHPHSDHWIGASAFPEGTALLASPATRQACLEWGARIVEDFQNPAEWEAWLHETEERLKTEPDRRVRAGLERSLVFIRYAMAEMGEYQPRYADRTFEGAVTFEGSARSAELRSLGRGHSEDDAVLLLAGDGIAFIGDVGFFHTQPFLGFCDLDRYREQMRLFQAPEFPILVPGHGPVGGKAEMALQLDYLEVMEERVGEVARRGGSLEEAQRIELPAPFDGWLMGGMERFEANVRFLFARCGGEVPVEA
jgi:cyclase